MQGIQNIYLSNLNAVCYDGGRYAIEKGSPWSSYGTIKFAQSKLYYIFNGSCTIQVAGREYIGCAGDWFLIPQNVPHSYENNIDQNFGEWWIHFEIFPDSDIFERQHRRRMKQRARVIRAWTAFCSIFTSIFRKAFRLRSSRR